jgi:LAS superfamily LD-carboxypeptidase LdcB
MKYTIYLTGLLASAWLWASACGETAQANPQAAVSAKPEKTVPPGVDINYLMGKFDQMKDKRFDTVAMQYTTKPLMMLRNEAYEAFKKMHAAAKKDGVALTIISSTRNFQQQKAIWEAKWSKTAGQAPEPLQRAKVILQYSAMPGASRHHWGTDIDLNGLNNADFNKGGKFEKTYDWLVQHAHEYGYCQPYTAGRNQGYNEERWHWSYMPLSAELTRQYAENITDKDLEGFKGSETAVSVGIVENYVKGINTNCTQ